MENYQQNLRKFRQTPAIRDLFKTTHLSVQNFIVPHFIYDELKAPKENTSLPGVMAHCLDSILGSLDLHLEKGLKNHLIFPVPKTKKESHFDYSFDVQLIENIKKRFGNDIVLLSDLCLCSQTLSGHCGILNENGIIDNDKSVKVLQEKSLIFAKAGVDIISPSDMMDDRILAIRNVLNENSMRDKLIMSYSTKFSSSLYGPFRTMAQSTPKSGDRKSYQIDYCNQHDAISSSLRDKAQGADILMVKPAGNYLDIIYQLKHHPKLENTPLCAYQVSGEFAALHLLEKSGFGDFNKLLDESLIAIKRAGADLIITYGALNWIENFKGN